MPYDVDSNSIINPFALDTAILLNISYDDNNKEDISNTTDEITDEYVKSNIVLVNSVVT